MPAGEIDDKWMNMYIDTPMNEWNDPLADAYIGGVFVSMCGFFTATTLTLGIENERVVNYISDMIIKFAES